jgi:hypothetical protein
MIGELFTTICLDKDGNITPCGIEGVSSDVIEINRFEEFPGFDIYLPSDLNLDIPSFIPLIFLNTIITQAIGPEGETRMEMAQRSSASIACFSRVDYFQKCIETFGLDQKPSSRVFSFQHKGESEQGLHVQDSYGLMQTGQFMLQFQIAEGIFAVIDVAADLFGFTHTMAVIGDERFIEATFTKLYQDEFQRQGRDNNFRMVTIKQKHQQGSI